MKYSKKVPLIRFLVLGSVFIANHLLAMDCQTAVMLKGKINEYKPRVYHFIKDAPILGYEITSEDFGDIPEIIRIHLGGVDKTQYTSSYLRENIGSFIALQMKDATTPDFYIVGLSTKQSKYRRSTIAQAAIKNAKLVDRLKALPGFSELIGKDNHLVALLKIAPVEMIRMSDVGYSPEFEVKIESPWGEQTKLAGRDAFLTKNEKGQWYMINSDDSGNPISYVPVP